MDLLDFLTSFLQCQYLSDLRNVRITAHQVSLLQELPVAAFSMEEYQEAVSYLIEGPVCFQTLAEAKEAVINALLSNTISPLRTF